jgi:phosphatidylserine/phosphatidylglycerophosphate/cardiolipin synthase-like enzyme
MKLLVQPSDGIMPLIQGIEKAKHSIDIVIFRFDRSDIERALENALARGVAVHALIAYLNRGGEKKLRKLEMRLLQAGVTVTRTSDDLIRYHDKLMIVDGRELYLLAFNFTYLDVEHSRSFGVVTEDCSYVQEAMKLFEADTLRRRYVPALDDFVVSPLNARKQLAAFLQDAKQQLLIYDPKISDRAMIRLLEERARVGVEVKIIGRLTRRTEGVPVRWPATHLHARAIVRDRRHVFIGSQSLCEAELDARREVGIISRDQAVVDGVIRTFEEDWTKEEHTQEMPLKDGGTPAIKATKKAVKAIAKELPPMVPILEEAVRKVVGSDAEVNLDAEQVEETVRGAIKEVVKEVVKDAVQEVVEQKELEKLKV